MNGLVCLLNVQKQYPSLKLTRMPEDKIYCEMSRDELAGLHVAYRTNQAILGLDKYKSPVNDCPDFSFREVQYIKDQYFLWDRDDTPCVGVAFSDTHACVVVWHTDSDFVFIEPQLDLLTEIELTPNYIERV